MNRSALWLWVLIGGAAGTLLTMLAVFFFGDTNVNIGAVSTGGFALAGLLLGARLGRVTEYEKWLREKRLEWYGQYAESIYLLTLVRGLSDNDYQATKKVAIAAMARVEIVAPQDIQRLSAALHVTALRCAAEQRKGNAGSPEEAAAYEKYAEHWHLFIARSRESIGVSGAAGVKTKRGKAIELLPGVNRK